LLSLVVGVVGVKPMVAAVAVAAVLGVTEALSVSVPAM